MSNSVSRSWIVGGWCTAVAAVVAGTVAFGADISTSVLTLVLGITPAVIALLVAGGGTAAPTVAEILHAVETKSRP